METDLRRARVGKYAVLGEIARGGMGAVFLAHDLALDRKVALKVLVSGRKAGSRQRDRFLREAQALAHLDHPGIVRVHEVGEEDGLPYLALELVEGASLEDRLRDPLSIDEAARLVARVARAVEHAHQRGILHRDLKPSNVLLDGEGDPILADFGLSSAQDPESSRLTQSGHLLGTPGYWPPEQAFGHLDRVGPHSDVYGLGGLLHACLTGEPPVSGGSLIEMISGLRAPPEAPSVRRPQVDARLDAICLRCLAREPKDRYSTALELAEDLEAWRRDRRASADARRLRFDPRWLVLLFGLSLLGGLVAARTVGGRAEGKPTAASTLIAVAEAQLKRYANQDALASYSSVLALEPGHVEALLGRARARKRLHDEAGAAADVKRALEFGPEQARPWAYQAMILADRGDSAQAQHAAAQAVRLGPELPYSWMARAYVNIKREEFASGRRDLERALEIDPADAEAWVAMARVMLVGLERVKDGLKCAEQAVALDPDDPQALATRGYAHYLLGDLEGAAVDLERAVDRSGRNDSEVLVNRAVVRRLSYDYAGAARDLDRAVEVSPDHFLARFNRALLRITTQDLEGAQRDLDRALSIEPRSMEALYQRVRVQGERGDLLGARADARTLLASLPPEDSRRSTVRAWLRTIEESLRSR